MKKFLLIVVIAAICVGAYFLYEEIKIEPEIIKVKPTKENTADDPTDDIEIIDKSETLEKRYSKLPFEYPEFPKTKVPEEFKAEVHAKFVDWLQNNNPPVPDAEFATWEEEILPILDGKIVFYKTRSIPEKTENVKLPDNWKIAADEKKPCAMYLVFPPYENDLLQEYWVKFVIHLGSEGRIFTYALRKTQRSGFVWKFAGQSVE